jgi:hypothetical protein
MGDRIKSESPTGSPRNAQVVQVQARDNQNAHSDDLPDGFGLASSVNPQRVFR